MNELNNIDYQMMQAAIKLSKDGMDNNRGGPFGAVIVKGDKIVGEGQNSVTSTNDPTAHAEIVAIKNACMNLNTFILTGCTLYTSCEPCPMCLGAIYWARIDKVFYACSRNDAKMIDFDDEFIYSEFNKSNLEKHIKLFQIERGAALDVFNQWKRKIDKKRY